MPRTARALALSLVVVTGCADRGARPKQPPTTPRVQAAREKPFRLKSHRHIALPVARKSDPLKAAPVVAVTYPVDDPLSGIVALGGKKVAIVRDLFMAVEWKIDSLVAGLKAAGESARRIAILQADRRVTAKIVKRVLYSCGLAGVKRVHVAVRAASPDETSGVIEVDQRVDPASKTVIKVFVEEGEGYTLTVGSQRKTIPLRADAYDTDDLRKALSDLRARADKRRLTVAADDGVRLGQLVQTIDVARSLGFARIAIR